ncbi:MAG: DUF1850 domain-containing protein [Geminicoccaceae bacterium]
MALCLLAGAFAAQLAVTDFTLAWTHSVERVRWEEDWRVEGNRLVLTESRIKGSGAGMEPPPDAVLADGFWHYRPPLAPLERIELARSGAVGDWQLCLAGSCRDLTAYLPADAPTGVPVTARACSD